MICPRCGGAPEALALRTTPELHDREEAWARAVPGLRRGRLAAARLLVHGGGAGKAA